VLGQVAVRVIARLTIVLKPAVRPNLGGADDLPADAKNDTDWLVVEN
jgi:hypothetical protein